MAHKGTTTPFTQCVSRFRFLCEPGPPPRCFGKMETRDRRPNAAAHPVPPEEAAMARAICNLDMEWVYIGVASYLPRRERWRPWPRGWLQDEECGRPSRRERCEGGGGRVIVFRAWRVGSSTLGGSEATTSPVSNALDAWKTSSQPPFCLQLVTLILRRPRLDKTCHRWSKRIVWMAYPNRPLTGTEQRNLQGRCLVPLSHPRKCVNSRGVGF